MKTSPPVRPASPPPPAPRLVPLALWPVMSILMLLLAAPALLHAMIANPAPFTVSQPGGAVITLRLFGDEKRNGMEDMQGFTVVKNDAGAFVYAVKAEDGTLKASSWVVGVDSPVTAGLTPHLRAAPPLVAGTSSTSQTSPGGGSQPAPRIAPTGIVKNLVILCRFSDHPLATHTRSQADFEALFNSVTTDSGVGAPAIAPTGSVRDYFREVSNDALTLHSTVTAWVTLPHPEAYYAGAHHGFDNAYPANVQGMAAQALQLVDAQVDFSQFDQNNDGYIDSITFIHSGYGAEADVGPNTKIWSAKTALAGDWTSAEGVKVRDFHTEPSLFGTTGTDITRIAVICHETCHFFGLPDLYDTDGTSRGAGSYCLMANAWGYDRTQLLPPHLCAWCKVQLGWHTPVVIQGRTDFYQIKAIEPFHSGSDALGPIYKITNGYPAGEYLLIENRALLGFDAGLPDGGLAIWHIDESKPDNTDEGFPTQADWPENGKHYKVALLQADGYYELERNFNNGLPGAAGFAGDLYRNTGLQATPTLTPTTVPNTHRYQNGNVAESWNSITGISAGGNGAVMSFTYSGLSNRMSDASARLTVPRFSAAGTFEPLLDFNPAVGTSIMIVNNTGFEPIKGTFTNLPQGQLIPLTIAGQTYHFVANYYGGTGNDFVLQWGDTRSVAWGANDWAQTGTAASGNPVLTGQPRNGALAGRPIVSESMGARFSVAIAADGNVIMWGAGIGGTPEVVTKNGALAGKAPVAVACGEAHALVLCSDGTLAAWGPNTYGELGDGTTVAADRYSPVAVKTAFNDGSALAGKTISAIGAGQYHSVVLCSDGTVVTWGRNEAGQLGIGNTINRLVPTAVNLGGKVVKAIAAGATHTLALATDGSLSAWGSGLHGALGNGSTPTTATSPVLVTINQSTPLWSKTITQIAAGNEHSAALCSDGTVAVWGWLGTDLSTNWYTTPTPIITSGALAGKTVTSLAAGAKHITALCSDGTAAAWGLNSEGQLGNGSTATPAPRTPVTVSIAALQSGEKLSSVSSGSVGNGTLAQLTVPPAPIVTTLAATAITGTTATLNADVKAQDNATTVSFIRTPGGGTTSATTPATVTASATTAVSANVTGLLPGTTYTFQAQANNAAGTRSGANLTFTTLSNSGDLSALVVSGVTYTPTFASGTTSYTAAVPYTTSSVTVTATTVQSAVTLKVNGSNVSSGTASGAISLAPGLNTITIVATPQTGSAKTYTVAITRIAPVPGSVLTDFNPSNSTTPGISLLEQPDGRVLMSLDGPSVRPTFLTRFLANGTADSSFVSAVPFHDNVTVLPDGKIYAFGALARYNANGSTDPTFNSATTTQGMLSAVVQPDGKLLVSGNWTIGSPSRQYFARLNTDGSIDYTFPAVSFSSAPFLVRQTDGTLLAWGSFTTAGGQNRTGLARITTAGTVDPNFNPVLANTSGNFGLASVVVQADGKIIVGGYFNTVNGTSRSGLARLNANGSLDTTWTPTINSGVDVVSLVLQTDGKLLIGGSSLTTVNGTPRVNFARLNADGTLDTTFADAALDINSGGTVTSLYLQKDGRILVGGGFRTIGGLSRDKVARLENDLATESLSVTSSSRIQWLRGGSSGEAQFVAFEHSANGGATYTPLGFGTRIAGGWERTGLTLPAAGKIRARARIPGGKRGNSSSLADTEIAYGSNPEIAIERDAAVDVADGATLALGNGFLGSSSTPLVLTIKNTGQASLTLSPPTKDGANAADFTITNPVATTIAPGASTTFTVAFTPVSGTGSRTAAIHIVNNDTDESPFDLTLTGTILTAGSLDSGNQTAVDGRVLAIAVQPDNKIMLGGSFSAAGWASSNLLSRLSREKLARLNADGIIGDTTFPSGVNGTDDAVQGINLLPDGRMVVCGRNTGIRPVGGATVTRNYIARLDASGLLDASWNANIAFIDGQYYVKGSAIQPDGKLLVWGKFNQVTPPGSAAIPQWNIARYNTDGTLDTSFNPGAGNEVRSLLLLPDGSMIIGGPSANFYAGSNGNATPVLRQGCAKLTAAGVLEPSFNINFGDVHALSQTADGSVLVGTATGVRKFSLSGVEDTSFAVVTNGIVHTIAVQTDGRLLVGGAFTTIQPTGSATALALPRLVRLQANGAHDPAFVPANTDYGEIQCIAHRADGGLLIGGYYLGSSQGNFTRLINEPATQSLNVASMARVEWNRSGGGAEVHRVLFDLSTDNGTTWTPLGSGSRIGVTSNWQITSLSLPASGTVRVRGFTRNGMHGGNSTSIFEQTKVFSNPAADLPVVTLPTATDLFARGATLGATVASDSGAAITERGVIYAPASLAATPLLNQPGVVRVNEIGTVGAFSTPVNALAPSTVYTFRGYAINSLGVSYTAVASFTTPAPLPLTVVAANSTRPYGAADPALTGTLTGGAADNITAFFISSATPFSPPGTYAVVPSLVDPLNRLGKYTVTSTPGILTITPAATTITADAVGIGSSAASQVITLRAMVRSTTAGQPGVDGGTVTFQLKNGATNVGIASISSSVVAGAASANHSIPAGLSAGSYSISATYSGTGNFLTSTQSTTTLTVVDSPLKSLGISGFPPSLPAGLESTFIISARDAAGQVLPSYRGTIRFESSDPRATLPADYTFTAADNGLHVFAVTLRSAGTHYVRFVDPSVSVTGLLTGLAVTPRAIAPALMAWGHNSLGELGISPSTLNTPTTPVVVAPDDLESAPASIACGGFFTLIATSNQVVWSTGKNNFGQLGSGDQNLRSTFTRVLSESGPGFLAASKVAAGDTVAVALKADGSVVQWGRNPVTSVIETRPALVAGLTGITEIAAGYEFCLALKNDGTVWAWGSGLYGGLGQGVVLSRSAPVKVRNADGSGFLTGITAIAAGSHFALALKNDGSVWAWGSDPSGRLANTRVSLPLAVAGIDGPATAVDANGKGGLVLRADGSVVSWGPAGFGPVRGINGVGLLQNVTHISGTRFGQMARLADGSVVEWSDNFPPQRKAGVDGTTVMGRGPLALHSIVATVPPPATQFIASHPSTVNSGQSFALTLSAVDDQLNSVAYVGDAWVRSSQGETISPQFVSFTAADQGRKVVNLTLRYPGAHTLTYASFPDPTSTGSSAISVLRHPTQSLVSLTSSGSQITATADVFLTPEGGKAAGGTVKFLLLNSGGGIILGPFYGAVSASGTAGTIFTLPGGTAAGDYSLEAEFSGNALLDSSVVLRPLRLIAGGSVAPLDSTGGKYGTGSQFATYYSSTPAGDSGMMEDQLEGSMAAAVSGPLSYKLASQTATFTATSILPVGAVDQGSVGFTVTNATGAIVGLPILGPVVGGACTVSYILPPGLAPGDYVLTTVFSGGLTTASSRNERLITVLPTTSTVVANAAEAPYSPVAQDIILSGTVTSPADPLLSSGTVTFQLRNDAAGSAAVGPPVVCAVTAGQVEGVLTLPAGLIPGGYRIETSYTSGNPFIANSTDDTRNLTIVRIPLDTLSTAMDASLVTTGLAQTVQIQATVAPLVGAPISQGTVTFQVSRSGVALGTAVTSGTVASGLATATYTLPPAAESGAYTIEALYNGSVPPTGTAYAPSSGLAVLTLTTQQEAWRLQYFGTTDATGNAAPAADPDNDGLTNLAEYAFGQNPTSASSSSLPAGQRIGGNYSISFTQPAGVSGITYGAEWSPSLAPGSWTPIPDSGVGSVHTFSVPAADQRKFLRVTISEP